MPDRQAAARDKHVRRHPREQRRILRHALLRRRTGHLESECRQGLAHRDEHVAAVRDRERQLGSSRRGFRRRPGAAIDAAGTSLPSSSSIPNGGKLFAGRLRGDAGLS
jgi:hypothetical protein